MILFCSVPSFDFAFLTLLSHMWSKKTIGCKKKLNCRPFWCLLPFCSEHHQTNTKKMDRVTSRCRPWQSIDPEFVKVQNISRTDGPVLFRHVVVSSSGESALTQNFESWNSHNGAACEWSWPTFVPGTWPAGSVDASWLTFGSFLRCSCERRRLNEVQSGGAWKEQNLKVRAFVTARKGPSELTG